MSDKTPVDLSDPTHVKERAKKADDRDIERLEGLRQIMNSKQGRAWMHGHLSFCGIWRTSFMGDGNTWTNFREGMRAVGLPLMADITNNFPSQYLLMLSENKEK